MEDWLYYFLSITFSLAIYLLLPSLRRATGKAPAVSPAPLPPGPAALFSFGLILFLARSNYGIDLIIRTARSWYCPVFTIYFLSTPVVVVADRTVARRVLRPAHHHVPGYGPLWRALRHNLAASVLHPSCLRRHAAARRAALSGLVAGIARQMRGAGGGAVVVVDLLHRAMFHVLAAVCFGDEDGLDDALVESVTALQRELLTSIVAFQVFGTCPPVTKILFRRRWKRMLSIRRRQEEIYVPLIRARMARRDAAGESFAATCYVDSLLGLRIPDDGGAGTRHLTESEMVALCAELLASGTDTTVAVMQWTMANLVVRPEIQAKVRAEIDGVAGAGDAILDADEHLLQRMEYLRAVVLEALRRHPPARFMLPHAGTDEAAATLDGFGVPRHTAVNFTLASMALDDAVWPDAKQFRPERFLPGGEGEDVDLTASSKEIKMMPFGAGRRVCPGIGMAMLHLQYFVANLVREFRWEKVPGETVNLKERLEMSLVMKRPLRANVVPLTSRACMHKSTV
ncbi:hypothetical protein BS78_08G128000 [Paspalum vaginatum]|nr:hypothetical protein BS78_08G128000 [Paspalum vaginatum]